MLLCEWTIDCRISDKQICEYKKELLHFTFFGATSFFADGISAIECIIEAETDSNSRVKKSLVDLVVPKEVNDNSLLYFLPSPTCISSVECISRITYRNHELNHDMSDNRKSKRKTHIGTCGPAIEAISASTFEVCTVKGAGGGWR